MSEKAGFTDSVDLFEREQNVINNYRKEIIKKRDREDGNKSNELHHVPYGM